MSRIVSVFFPHFPIERLKRERASKDAVSADKSVPDNKPFAFVSNATHGLVLSAVNARSARDGLIPGMGLADARAILPHLLTAPAAPDEDASALLALARWSSRYSPTLNVDGDDGLWLDIDGAAHLFGGEEKLLADLARRLARAGFTTQLALAETLGAAHALARFARSSPAIVSDGKLAPALAPLPVEALRLEPATAGLLRRLGLKCIGQLYALPRASLERRFHSKEAAEAALLRLDQALGRKAEPRAPLLSAPEMMARLPFPEPLITHEGVVAGLDHLAHALCTQLARTGKGALCVALWIARADGTSFQIEAGLSAPSREPNHLQRLLQDKTEAIDMGFGVDLIGLAATSTETLPPAQTSLAEADARTGTELLVDRLVNRLGLRAVRRLFPRASHIPELAQMPRSAFAGRPLWREEASPKPPRPPRLFAKPEALVVLAEVPEGPPARFTWRRTTHRVVKAEGPERIAPEWWRELRSRGAATNSIPPLDGEGGSAAGRAGWGEEEGDSPPPGAQMRADLPTRGSYGVSGDATGPNPSPAGEGGEPGLASGSPDEGVKRSTAARPRDYYRIEDETGCRYWVFREGLYQESEHGPPCWYLHGVFA
jgi:protein ImuB